MKTVRKAVEKKDWARNMGYSIPWMRPEDAIFNGKMVKEVKRGRVFQDANGFHALHQDGTIPEMAGSWQYLNTRKTLEEALESIAIAVKTQTPY